MDEGIVEQIYQEIKVMVDAESEQICLFEKPMYIKTNLGFEFKFTMVDNVNGILRGDYGVTVDSLNYESLIKVRDYIKQQQINDAMIKESYSDPDWVEIPVDHRYDDYDF